MNIFFLHINPVFCARYHVDKHVVKMIMETCQLLCCVWHILDPHNKVYTPPLKQTHANHPCAKWARQSYKNYLWLCILGIELCKEYTYRYEKKHKYEDIIYDLYGKTPFGMESIELTIPPLCMPDEYQKLNNFIQCYRSYYTHEKKQIHKWKKRRVPSFISE